MRNETANQREQRIALLQSQIDKGIYEIKSAKLSSTLIQKCPEMWPIEITISMPWAFPASQVEVFEAHHVII